MKVGKRILTIYREVRMRKVLRIWKMFCMRFGFILLGLCFTHQARAQWEAGVAFDVIPSKLIIYNMPFEIRNVPFHPEDVGHEGYENAPIERRWYEVREWNRRVGVRVQWTSPYVNIALSGLISHMHKKEDMEERNYSTDIGGKERGIGISLTYCKLRTGGILLASQNKDVQELDLTGEIAIETPISRYVHVGGSVSYFVVKVSNGWDRSGNFHMNTSHNLVHVFPTSGYLRGKLNNFLYVYSGVTFFPRIMSHLGKTAEIKHVHGFIFGLTLMNVIRR